LDKRLVAAGQQTQLSIWDTAGQERFHALGPIYYRDAGTCQESTLSLHLNMSSFLFKRRPPGRVLNIVSFPDFI
jgi:hypothetical protein